ncbi:MAG: TM2 domain-containing protein [Oscillospiraceae bacterium]
MNDFENPNVNSDDSANNYQSNPEQQQGNAEQYQQYQQQPYQQQPYQPQPPYNSFDQKSKIAAGVLGILLGSLGIHNFYLGYTGKAIAQLLITLFTCGIGAFATSIWGLVEGILILTGSIAVDGRGVPLKD